MNDANAVRQLLSELDTDIRYLQRCGAELTTYSKRWELSVDDDMALIAVAYGLHNLYGAFEGYFLRISKHFENHLPPQNWHAELVEKMLLDIPEIRPALFDETFVGEIDELRRFRHVFRNLYKSRLNAEKVRLVQKICQGSADRFQPYHNRFCQWLRELIDSHDE